MSASYSYSYFDYSYSYSAGNDHPNPLPRPNTISIPINSPPDPAAAAVKIQSAFRAHLVRSLVRTIRAVDAEAAAAERLIQRQETVDAVRRDPQERLRLGEKLMALLLRLDAVPGFYPPVRELRRRASRRIVGLQEVLDAVVAAPDAPPPDEFPASLADFVEKIKRRKG